MSKSTAVPVDVAKTRQPAAASKKKAKTSRRVTVKKVVLSKKSLKRSGAQELASLFTQRTAD